MAPALIGHQIGIAQQLSLMLGCLQNTEKAHSSIHKPWKMFRDVRAECFIIGCEKSELGCPGIFQLMERLSSNQKQLNNSIEPNCFIMVNGTELGRCVDSAPQRQPCAFQAATSTVCLS